MRKDLLLLLADGLEKLPPENFDMHLFARSKDPVTRLTPACGTAGCALGWAPTILNDVENLRIKLVRDKVWGDFYTVVYQNKVSFAAGASLFGISEFDSEYLFDPAQYDDENNVTKQEVIQRIRDFVANEGRQS